MLTISNDSFASGFVCWAAQRKPTQILRETTLDKVCDRFWPNLHLGFWTVLRRVFQFEVKAHSLLPGFVGKDDRCEAISDLPTQRLRNELITKLAVIGPRGPCKYRMSLLRQRPFVVRAQARA